MSGCATCGKLLERRNKSGYCAPHASAARAADPAWRAKLSASIRRKMAHDPAFLEQKRAQARRLSQSPDVVARRTAHFDQRIRDIGHKVALNPEVRARAGRSITEVRLAWCPSHLRAEYLDLVRTHLCSAAEARAMIEDQNELEMARWRRSIGVVEEVEQPAVEVAPKAFRRPQDEAFDLATKLFGVTEDEILSPSRERRFVLARYALAVGLRRARFTTTGIAEALNRGDHTTAMNLLSKAEEWAKRDRDFARKVEQIAACWAPMDRAA